MSNKTQPIIFVGIDWGTKSHQACVITSDGTVLDEKVFPHSGEGLAQLIVWILEQTDCEAEQVAVAIEVPHGPVVDSLLDKGFQVFSINPKQLDRFRDRFSPAGAKDDRKDARVLADAVRTDPDCMRTLDPKDPQIVELREWTRIRENLVEQRTQATNQFRQQLWRYFPQFLDLKVDLSAPWVLALWKLVPTPEAARKIRPARIAKLLSKYRIRRFQAEDLLQILREKPVPAAPGVLSAACNHIRIHVRNLERLAKEIRDAEHAADEIVDLFIDPEECSPEDQQVANEESSTENLSTPPENETEFSDAKILFSIPGVGKTILAILIAEASPLLKERDYQALRCLCGVAPITKQSGKSHRVVRRRACQKRLVHALYHWSRVSVQHDPVSKAKYAALRARGHSNGRALRSVADRLLAVACAMLTNGTLYDPSLATPNA